MITVYPVIRQRMRDFEVTDRELARILGISWIAFQLKMWGIKQWTLPDVVKLCGFFNTPNAEHLFVRNYNKQQFLESQEENGNV